MAKRKKDSIEDDDFFKTLKYNYLNTPGYDSMVKIIFFILIAIVLILTARITIAQEKKEEAKAAEEAKTSEVVQQNTSLKKLLDAILDKKTSITIKQGDQEYMFENIEIKDNVVSGLFETVNGTKKFKYKDNTIYEIVLSNEVENNSLFDGLNIAFIIPSKLVKILETNKTIKTSSNENVTYTYDVSVDDVSYEINVVIVQDEVVSIVINNENINYTYEFK